MEWVLVMWFVSGNAFSESGVNQHIQTTRVNTEAACAAVLRKGYIHNMRGICVHDPVKR